MLIVKTLTKQVLLPFLELFRPVEEERGRMKKERAKLWNVLSYSSSGVVGVMSKVNGRSSVKHTAG